MRGNAYRHAQYIGNGYVGSDRIADTVERTGEYASFYIVEEAKFHTLTGDMANSGAHVTEGSAYSWPAGTWIIGIFTAIKLHSGVVVAYLA